MKRRKRSGLPSYVAVKAVVAVDRHFSTWQRGENPWLQDGDEVRDVQTATTIRGMGMQRHGLRPLWAGLEWAFGSGSMGRATRFGCLDLLGRRSLAIRLHHNVSPSPL